MRVILDSEATRRLDEYIGELRESLSTSSAVDAAEVEADVREHIERELSSADGPVTLDTLEAVLEQLGSPRQWVRDEQPPAEGHRIVRERLGRRFHRALLAAGVGFVVTAVLLLIGIKVQETRWVPFNFVGHGLVWTLRRDAALWLGFVGAFVAAAGAIVPRAQLGATRRHMAGSFVASTIGLSVLAAVGLLALVALDRMLFAKHYASVLAVTNARRAVATALNVTAWLVPWIAYLCALLVAMATRSQRVGAERTYFLGLLLWPFVLAVAVFIVSIWSLTLDLNIIAPAIAGLAIFAAAGLARTILPAQPTAAPTLNGSQSRDVASLVGRAVLTLGISLAPVVLFYCRGIAPHGVPRSYVRPIVENGVFYVGAGLALGVGLAFWRRPRQALEHKWLAVGAGVALTFLVIAIRRDVALIDTIRGARVFVAGHARPMALTRVPSLGLALVFGCMLVAAMALVAYLASGLLMRLLGARPRGASSETPSSASRTRFHLRPAE